jgi:osmotically-inducible protein OsmY
VKEAAADKLETAKSAVSEKAADVKEAAADAVSSAGERIDEAKSAAADAAQQTETEMRQEIDAASATSIDFAEGDDTVIADRVRTELGQNEATRDIPSLNVESVGGVVTLRGPKLEEFEKEAVEKVVRAVEGVREVHTEHILTDAPEDEATFVG